MKAATIPRPALAAAEHFPIAFHEDIAYQGPLGVAWASGRVNLIGEHTDYNDGFVLPIAVDRVAAFAGRRRNDALVRLWSSHFTQYAEISLLGLPETFEQQRHNLPNWARYILGVITELVRLGMPISGFDAVVAGDVPLGGGMSSSASLEVATAQLCALFSQGRLTIGEYGAVLTPMQLATLCQRAEHLASGLRSGILDQAASCLGQPGKAVFIDCRSYTYRYVPFEAPSLALVLIDSSVRRELASSAYNERRSQCEEAVHVLRAAMLQQEPATSQAKQISALRDISQEQFERYKRYLPQILRRRVAYVVAENARVLQVVKLLEQRDVPAVGPILWQGHAGLKSEYEVSCLQLDTLVEIAQRVPGVLGARMMGGGFGGCTINLVQNDALVLLRQTIEQQYTQRTGLQASIHICRAVGGPGKQVIR
ncbi:MAG: galactokinase [Ktedonobacteraceae bacterium]|nr:galactokinase [Ktedonobacteraceae bacterium]